MSRSKRADAGDWQARAQMFEVGQTVALVNGGPTDEGRVIAVWPGIGMVDIQWPHTNYRHPVEDIHVVNPGEASYIAPKHETVPGGAGVDADLSMGKPRTENMIADIPPLVQLVSPTQEADERTKFADSASRVAKAFVKKSLYWNGRDRKYRCSKPESGSGQYLCPKKHCHTPLKPAIYKRENGESVRLLGCPTCMFLIRKQDIAGGEG